LPQAEQVLCNITIVCVHVATFGIQLVILKSTRLNLFIAHTVHNGDKQLSILKVKRLKVVYSSLWETHRRAL